jgi:hypothetical protein
VVAGRPPPDAIARHQGAPLIPAVEIGRGRHDRKFLETLDRALALDPTHRPQSAAEFRASVLGREAPVGKPAAVSHATIPRERNVVAGLSFPVTRRWGLNLGAVGLLVAIGGVLALRPDLREQLLPPYGSAETTLSGAQSPSSEAAEGQADPSSGDAAPQGRGGRPASQDGSRSAGRIAAGRPPRASVDTPEPQDTSGPANTIAEGALPQPPVDVPGPEGAPQPATTMADSGQPQATAETPATDADAAAESTEQKGKGVRVAEGIISGLALAAGIVGANEANKRERRAAHTQPPNSVPPPPGYAVPPPPPHTLAAPPVQFVLRCVFPGDSNSYYVTSTNEIVSISPNGQAVTIGARVAATAPGYEWMYQTPRLLYGVVNGQIYASAPDGRPRQVGYITNP